MRATIEVVQEGNTTKYRIVFPTNADYSVNLGADLRCGEPVRYAEITLYCQGTAGSVP